MNNFFVLGLNNLYPSHIYIIKNIRDIRSLLGVWRSLLGVRMILLGVLLLHDHTLARLIDAKCTWTNL